jgi:hypothetical protein
VRRYVVRRPTSVGLLSRGKDYSVRDLGGSLAGYTDLLKKELGVSLAADAPQTRWTQLHELSHVRHSLWSPPRIAARVKKMTGKVIKYESIRAAEDARINELLVRRVRDAHNGFGMADTMLQQIRRDLGGYVASHASPRALADTIRPACNPVHVARVDAFLRRLGGMAERELTVLRVTVPLAQLIDECNAGPQAPEPQPQQGKGDDDKEDGKGDGGDDKPAPGDEGGDEDGDEDGGSGGDEDADKTDKEAFGKPDAHADGCRGALPGAGNEQAPAWSMPTIHEPPLMVPMRGGNFQVTTGETGKALRWSQLHRIGTDGVVFRRARRHPGALQKGTVLIDVSASVSFNNEDLRRVVEMLPHATVAIYSGIAYQRSHIVIVARSGRRVADLADWTLVPRGGDNMCDGPALLWLSRQAAPRLWICDGYTTDDDCRHTIAQEEECDAIMRAAGIVQVMGAMDDNRQYTRLKASRSWNRGELRHITQSTGGGIAAVLGPVLKDIERGRV